VKLTIDFHTVPKLRIDQSYTYTLPACLYGVDRDSFTLIIAPLRKPNVATVSSDVLRNVVVIVD
jgi:hypothetical protein